VAWIRNLCLELGQSGLEKYGFERRMIDEAVRKGMQASSMKANPVELTPEELSEVLERSIGFD